MTDNMRTKSKTNIMEGRMIYLVVIVFIIQTTYPISFGESLWRLIGFQTLYLLMIIAGIAVVQRSPRNFIILIVLGIVWMISGIAFAIAPSTPTLVMAYVSIGVYQAMVAWVLAMYIFSRRIVNRDVIYAVIAVYLLIGAVFVGIFGVIEELTVFYTGQHAFADNLVGADETLPWQHLVYYSYATLTTLGYGDITPVSLWARSFAALEAITGVLFTTVVIARLVGLYAAGADDTTD